VTDRPTLDDPVMTESQLLRQRNAYFEWLDWGYVNLPHSTVPREAMLKIRGGTSTGPMQG
jgi:hypothetical protein